MRIRIRDPLIFLTLDPGSEMKKIRIRDGKNSDPGWKKFGSGIRDKQPGSGKGEYRIFIEKAPSLAHKGNFFPASRFLLGNI